MNEMHGRSTRWHRGAGPCDKTPARGMWYAEVGGTQIALAWVVDNTEVGDPGRYSGHIYGEPVERTTLREFKDAVETVRAWVLLALRGAQ
jgi:hypothetical protein